MSQLTDMISALTSLIPFHINIIFISSARNTPHRGVGAFANAGDNAPLNGVAPVIK